MKRSVKKLSILSVLLVGVMTLFQLSAFASVGNPSISAPGSITLDPKQKQTISYSISPEGGAYGLPEVTSSDTNIAWAGFYNNTLQVEAYEPGNCTVTLRIPSTSVETRISVTVTGTPKSSSSSQDTRVDYDAVTAYRSETVGTPSSSRASSSRAASSRTSSSTKPTGSAAKSDSISLTKKAPREEVIAAASSKSPLRNYASVSADSLNAASGSVFFDTQSGNAVVGRLTIQTANAAKLTGDIKTGVYAGTGNTEKVQKAFDKLGKKTVVILCEQANFGMNVSISANIGSMQTENLKFYTYDPSTNKYSQLKGIRNISKDDANYLSFTTQTGGYIVVSEGAL